MKNRDYLEAQHGRPIEWYFAKKMHILQKMHNMSRKRREIPEN